MRYFIIVLVLSIIGCSGSKKLATANNKKDTLRQTVAEQRAHQRDSRVGDKAVLNIEELSYYDIDKSYSVNAKFKIANSKGSLDIPTSSGKNKAFYKYGTVYFTLKGEQHQLSIYRNIAGMRNPVYKDYLFLPFTDDSNGEETYGGGRYIDLKIGDIVEGNVILDFNIAYNPYCAYGDGWNCPIPPAENHIPVKLLVGEKAFKGTKSNRN